MPIVASDFDLRNTPEDELPYDPKNIGGTKPQVRRLELKPEPNVPTPTQAQSPPVVTETGQQEPAIVADDNAQQSLNLRG
jgi:hypothetical protein